MGENAKGSLGMTPDETQWLRQGDKFWTRFRDKEPGRRDVFWVFIGLLLFFFGNLFACPMRPT